MNIQQVKISNPKPHPKNPRIDSESQIARLQRSIERYGFVNPIIATKDKMILAGHGRMMAAQKQGLETVPVIFLQIEGKEADAYVIEDNRIAELADWDLELLGDFNIDLADFDLGLDGLLKPSSFNLRSGTALEDFFEADGASRPSEAAKTEKQYPVTFTLTEQEQNMWLAAKENHKSITQKKIFMKGLECLK